MSLTRDEFITEEMLFIWDVNASERSIYFVGKQCHFITFWLSFWAKNLASFDFSAHLLSKQ